MKKTIIMSAVAVALAGAAQAQFSYNNGDLLIGVRSSSASKDLLVDIGPASSLTTRTTLTGSKFTTSQVTSALGSVWDGANFSVFADDAASDTLWVTAPRAPFQTKSAAWAPKSDNNQSVTESKMEGIGLLANTEAVQPGISSTATAIVLTNNLSFSGGSSYSIGIKSITASGTAIGNFRGTFQGNVENTLPTGFATGGTPVISDLYSLVPSAGSASYLGYFAWLPNGTFQFTPASYTITQPSITVTNNVGVNTVSFSTVTGINYTLLTSSVLNTPLSAWTVVGSSVITGDGTTQSINHSPTNSTQFYVLYAY